MKVWWVWGGGVCFVLCWGFFVVLVWVLRLLNSYSGTSRGRYIRNPSVRASPSPKVSSKWRGKEVGLFIRSQCPSEKD